MVNIKKIKDGLKCCTSTADLNTCNECPYCEDGYEGAECVTDLLNDIQEMLSLSVKVIRCAECKYYEDNGNGSGWCGKSGHDFGTSDTWYCADAERCVR